MNDIFDPEPDPNEDPNYDPAFDPPPAEPHVENGKAAMRGNINTLGIETAAGLWADELAGPFAPEDHARIRGAFLAAFEAGMAHQIARGRVS